MTEISAQTPVAAPVVPPSAQGIAFEGSSGGVAVHVELDRSVLLPGRLVTAGLSFGRSTTSRRGACMSARSWAVDIQLVRDVAIATTTELQSPSGPGARNLRRVSVV
jgi:hypothetical protein